MKKRNLTPAALHRRASVKGAAGAAAGADAAGTGMSVALAQASTTNAGFNTYLSEDFLANRICYRDGATFAAPFSRVYYCLTYKTHELSEALTSWQGTWNEIRDRRIAQEGLVPRYWLEYQNRMEMFINEDIDLGQISDGRVRMANTLGSALALTVSEEGALVALDTLAIPENAWNVENAHQLIDFTRRPDIDALHMTIMGYDSGNQAGDESLDADV